MNGRMVRKTLSFSKEEEMLKASCAWRIWFITMEDLSNPCEKNPIAIKDNGIPDLQLWQLA
jgi:hypothetical protein